MSDRLMGKVVIFVDGTGKQMPALVMEHIEHKFCTLVTFENDRAGDIKLGNRIAVPFDDNSAPYSWHTIDPREIVIV